MLTASTPLPEASVAEPRAALPSLKDNVPFAAAGVTVAVSVIDCPDTVVVAEEAKVTVVGCSAAALTWTDSALDVDD